MNLNVKSLSGLLGLLVIAEFSIPAFGDTPAGDFNRIGIYRQFGLNQAGYPILSNWYVDSSGSQSYQAPDPVYVYGLNGDVPIMGDWTGTHHLQMGIYRGGLWAIDWNDNHTWDSGDYTFSWGVPGDIPVVGDWTHTGKLQIGVVRTVGTLLYWYVNTSPNCGNPSFPQGCDYSNTPSQYVQVFSYGLPGDTPVIGNWNHQNGYQNILGVGTYRPADGMWRVNTNPNMCDPTAVSACNDFGANLAPGYDISFTFAPFGNANGVPVTGCWYGSCPTLNAGFFYAPPAVNGQAQPATWDMDADDNQTPSRTASYGLTNDLPVTGPWVTPYTAGTISDLNNCIQNMLAVTTCVLAPNTYTMTTPVVISRSNVTVMGGSTDASQTKLVRDRSYTGPLIQVNVPGFTAPGVTVSDLTICGGIDVVRDINMGLPISLGASSVGCPRNQTTSGFTSGSCGDMVYRITLARENGQQPSPSDFQCADFEVDSADTAEYLSSPSSPFPSTHDYSLTISHVDLEDSAGHALSLFENGTPPGSFVNDVFIRSTTINNSAVTGILYGANFAPTYHTQVCDNNSNWLNDHTVFAPRNIRVENSTFTNNNTGAMGGGAVRWLGLRNNQFINNYIHPQVGNSEGGTVEFDPCADQLQITGNYFSAPPASSYPTLALELYSRDLLIQGNTISSYPLEGVALDSTFETTLSSNQIVNNAQQAGGTGGVAVSTTGAITGPCGDPRDSRDVMISNNTITGQTYGVYLQEHDLHSTGTLRHGVNASAVNLTGSDSGDAVGQDAIVVWDSYNGPVPSVGAASYLPRALTPKAVSPQTARCSTGTQPQTFAFPASDGGGASHISSIETIFSLSGNDNDGGGGPDAGGQGCHFVYYPAPYNTIYLDGPGGGSTWSAGSSVVGTGGSDLSNGYCTIHAGWTPASMAEPFISPYIVNLPLVIEFPSSSSSSLRKHIYTVIQDDQGQISNRGLWTYWGWWATQ